MNESIWGLVLDGLVLVLLGATIVYAARLTRHLQNFREGRKDLEKLIVDLSTQINKAEGSIEELKTSARNISRELQSQLDEARAMGDDLEIMTRGANNMADRLDKAADRHRGAVNEGPSRNVRRPTPDEFPGFAIRDDDAERGMEAEDEGSLAERELMEALQSRKGHR